MKSATPAFLVLALLVGSTMAAGGSTSASVAAPDRSITKVVKLLENMMTSSKKDGETERELFAKHKCYCDTNEADKKTEIEDLTMQIGLLESKIAVLQASSEKLSKEVAQLTADMTANEEARTAADKLREKEKLAFQALEKDLVDAIRQMKEAIEVLSAVGADQSLGQSAADHEKYMARYDASVMLKLRTTVKAALMAASATVTKKQAATVESFLQAPFTATYTSQSAEVVGIIKDMKVTFEENLVSARAEEAAAIEAHDKYMATMLTAWQEMEASLGKKQVMLSSNDDDLATKKGQLADAVSAKEAAELFLEQLLSMCAEKAKQYEKRTLLRTNEEAAISQAISILNSDSAFETFGTVTATTIGGTSPEATVFLQRSQIRRHTQRVQEPRQKAQALLRKAAGKSRSELLSRVVAFLEAGNPFTVVLQEIEKMLGLIEAEGKADEEQLTWCKSERKTNNEALDEKKAQIVTLNGAIDALVQEIEDPETGLKVMIKNSEEQLQLNVQSQTTQTTERTELNVAYQKDIENLVEAESLLGKAIVVLKKYYSKILSSSAGQATLMQQGPSPPPTWEGDYKGQSGAGGTDAISMLEFILDNTKLEEEAAHKAERDQQHDFEDSMTGLKKEQKSLEEELTKLRLTLAEKEKLLLAKREDLKTTTEEKEAIEAYLEKIKPGCDFITGNIDLRKGNRVEETGALTSARDLLKKTPAYLTAVAAAHNETLGECLGICSNGEEKAPCKACLAHVTVPAYCAGHKDTVGCGE